MASSSLGEALGGAVAKGSPLYNLLAELLSVPLLQVEREVLCLYARKLEIASDLLASIREHATGIDKRAHAIKILANSVTWQLLESEGVNVKLWETRVARARADHASQLKEKEETATAAAAGTGAAANTLLSDELNRPSANSNAAAASASASTAATAADRTSTRDEKSAPPLQPAFGTAADGTTPPPQSQVAPSESKS